MTITVAQSGKAPALAGSPWFSGSQPIIGQIHVQMASTIFRGVRECGAYRKELINAGAYFFFIYGGSEILKNNPMERWCEVTSIA